VKVFWFFFIKKNRKRFFLKKEAKTFVGLAWRRNPNPLAERRRCIIAGQLIL
jgi:hypothetical protein